LDFLESDRYRQAKIRVSDLLPLGMRLVVGPMGTVKKPRVVGEAVFKPRWESAWWRISISGVSFHRSLFSLVLISQVSEKNSR
jgi:hypothetical protein